MPLTGSFDIEEVEAKLGEALRGAQGPLYKEMIDEVEPMHEAHELLRDLKGAGHPIILPSIEHLGTTTLEDTVGS
jgi:hypothetical protein